MSKRDGPSRAHQWLAKAVGTWNVEGLYYVAGSDEPVEAKGIERVEMFGPYWRRGELELSVFGSPVRGCTCVGFDPVKQVFVGTWYDTSNPYLYAYQGRFDEQKQLLVLTGRNTDPSTGKPSTYRSIEGFDLPDRRSLSLFVKAPGRKVIQILSYEYTRRGERKAAKPGGGKRKRAK